MDFPQFEFEIDLHYHNRILVILINKRFTYCYCFPLILATRHDDSHMPKLMRSWLQRSQSQSEVTTDDGVDQGKYQISENKI